jgi:hypothetical protein
MSFVSSQESPLKWLVRGWVPEIVYQLGHATMPENLPNEYWGRGGLFSVCTAAGARSRVMYTKIVVENPQME